MIRYEGVSIDVGGPLRVSDYEMHNCHALVLNHAGIHTKLTPRQTWVLYGVANVGTAHVPKSYAGLMTAILAIERSGRGFDYVVNAENPSLILDELAAQYVDPKEVDRIAKMGQASEILYNLVPSLRLNEGAREGVQLIHEHGLPQAIVTEAMAVGTIAWLKEPAVNLADYFPNNRVLGKDSAGGAGNIKVDLLRKANEEMGVRPERSIYIADTLGDIEAARAFGCDVGMVLNGMGLPQFWSRVNPKPLEFEDMEDAARYIVGLE